VISEMWILIWGEAERPAGPVDAPIQPEWEGVDVRLATIEALEAELLRRRRESTAESVHEVD
jgi:hypothetical protein